MESVQQRIKAVESRITSIREMISAGQKSEAQELFRDLKAHLDAEYRRMSPAKAEAKLSAVERAFYLPFIQDAWANTGISGVRWNSDPAKWRDALWSISDYVGYWTASLNEQVADNSV